MSCQREANGAESDDRCGLGTQGVGAERHELGTGSAGKLSGGISEALVATGLGLAVAIPTLVVHGFLSHRIHKGLALLERYSLEFVTAVEEAQSSTKPPPSRS